MTWPTVFGNLLGGNQPLSLIDGMFQQTAQMLDIPCAASGATAISLTPLVNCPVLTGYTEFCAARFRAAANSGAGVTAQVNGLGFLPVYKANGVTQCGLNDLVVAQEYVVRFSQALGGGVGGWFLEAPAFGSGGGGGGGSSLASTPGGRLTLQAGIPVMGGSVSSQTIYYAPYVHPFVPIYNGSTVQMYQFTTGLSDTVGLQFPMAGNAAWPIAAAFDVFVTLNAGVLVLATVQWTTPGFPAGAPARATNLAVFGGFLTNATLAVMRINATTTISVPPNQGTFLGSFETTPIAGNVTFNFGGAASGGLPANFAICNYYNKVLFNTIVIDNGAPYTYTALAPRQARGSANNTISFIQSDSERANTFVYNATTTLVNTPVATCFTGIAFNGANFNAIFQSQNTTATACNVTHYTTYPVSAVGTCEAIAAEESDGSHANTFCATSGNFLFGSIWL